VILPRRNLLRTNSLLIEAVAGQRPQSGSPGGHCAETGIGLPPSMWLSFDGAMCGATCADAEQETAATADDDGRAIEGESIADSPWLEDADADAGAERSG